jgi:HEAT repeat protein
VPALGKLLGDRETAVRRVAAEALVSQARGAHDRPGLVAAAACLAVVPVAAENAKDEDNEVRRSCLEAVKAAAAGLGSYIGQTMPSEPLPVAPRPGRPLPGGGANPAAPPWQVVRPATEVLGKAVRPLLPLLASDKPAAQRVQVCEALEAIAAIRARLLRAAGGTDALAAALGGKEAPLLAGLKGAVGDLADCADDKDVEVRLAALYVLEDLGPAAAPAVDKVVKGFKADDPFVRWAAARVLGKMAPAEAKTAVPALAGRVGDENADVRVTALAALVRYGPDALDAIEKVAPKVKAGDEQTRLWAVRVLAAVGTDGRKQTTAPLIEALAAKEVPVRRTAVAALVRFGKPDQATTAALRAALGDPDAEVRRTASEALLAEE